jgi:hypothetical protein
MSSRHQIKALSAVRSLSWQISHPHTLGPLVRYIYAEIAYIDITAKFLLLVNQSVSFITSPSALLEVNYLWRHLRFTWISQGTVQFPHETGHFPANQRPPLMGSYTILGKRCAGLKYSCVLILGLGDTKLGVFCWAVSTKLDMLAGLAYIFYNQIGLHIWSCPVRETRLVGIFMANIPH